VELRAAKSIAAPPERVYAFLESFDRHVELIHDRVEPLAVDSTGSTLRLCGPLGVRRTLSTTLTYSQSPTGIVGRVKAGQRTRGTVRWSIQHSDRGSWVEIVGRTEVLGVLDAMLLRLGGRRWLVRSLHHALEGLEERMRQ
jgi:hypothetical protein